MIMETPMEVDTLIDAWYVVTMNATRDIIHRGSVAIQDDKIVEVGKTIELEKKYVAKKRLGGERFVLTPGLINTHIHITGELTGNVNMGVYQTGCQYKTLPSQPLLCDILFF